MKERTIYALGFFDGVHLGHAALLAACRELAKEYGCKAGVLTFATHPDALVLSKAPGLINTDADRERLLRAHGMDTVITLPFDENLRTMSWQDFFRLLTEKHNAGGIVCGEDFRFGYRGEGNAAKLKAACKNAGIPCVIVPQQRLNGTVVSSTYVRELLAQGEMEKAVKFLGHPHILTGKVVAGRQLGRTIGVPTANILLPEGLLIPKCGVYACTCHVGGHCYLAVTNIGSRPTVEGHQVRAESWILDFEGDLYGKEITLAFYTFLREEEKFPDLASLQAEIQKNGEETRKFFGKI